MKLYQHPVSTTSRAILLFAADHGIALELQTVDLFTGEHLKPAYASINPNQAVPVLEDGAFRLTESSAILKYLADAHGSAAYPNDAQQRARVNERMDWFNTGLARDFGYGFAYPQLYPHHRRPTNAVQAETLAWGGARARRWLDILDEDLIGPHRRFVCGDAVTLADYLGIALVTLGEAVQTDYRHWRNISRWIAAMKSRPGWAAANDAFYTHIVAPRRGAAFAAL